METNQALKVIKRLESVYPGNPFEKVNGKAATEEYIKALANLDYTLAEAALDDLIQYGVPKSDGTHEKRFCPTPAEINAAYLLIKHACDASYERQKDECLICNSDGFILHKKIIEGMPYDVILHCICKAGMNYKYDGRNNSGKNPKSEYRIEPVTKYYDVEKLKQKALLSQERESASIADIKRTYMRMINGRYNNG